MAEGPDESTESADDGPGAGSADATESRRAAVEAKYNFDDFRPADMAEMTLEEWEAAFEPDSWITGPALVERVEAELTSRVADGELFAVVERHEVGGEPHLLVYTDAEYAIVSPDGRVEGEGALGRDVEPIVALCAMESFEVADPPDGPGLPHPDHIEEGAGDLGHRLLLAVAVVQAVAGLVVLLSPIVVDLGPGAGVLTTVVGVGFLAVSLVLGVLVANARLSDRFRAAAYRDRLRAAGVGQDERPSFLPAMGEVDEGTDRSQEPRS